MIDSHPALENPATEINAQEARAWLWKFYNALARLEEKEKVAIPSEVARLLDGACHHLRLPLYTRPSPEMHPSRFSLVETDGRVRLAFALFDGESTTNRHHRSE